MADPPKTARPPEEAEPDADITPPALRHTLREQQRLVRVADYYQGGDAAPAFLAAIQTADASGRSVDIAGEWVFHSACYASGYVARLVGHAKIDASSVADTYALVLGGTEGAAVPLSADAGIGDNELSCPLAVLPGDIIRLVSSEPWSSERRYYVKGELAWVAGSAGGTITLHGQLNDSYTAAATTATRINAKPVSIQDGIELLRNANSGGILVQWARELALSRCFVQQARERSLYLKECLGGYVADCGCYADHVPGGRTNYGLAFNSCAQIHTVGGRYRAGRHAVSTGGTFPCRDLHFADVEFDNDSASGTYCLDAHANGERFSYSNVTSLNGAVVQAVDCHFIGGRFGSRNFLNALSVNPGRNSRYYTFSAVTIENPRLGGRGLTLSPAIRGLTIDGFAFSGGSVSADIPFYCIPDSTGDTRFGSIEFDSGFRLISVRPGLNVGSLVGPNVADPLIGRVLFANGSIVSYGAGIALVIRSAHKSIGYAGVLGCVIDHRGANACVLIRQAKQAQFSRNHGFGNGVSWRAEISECDQVEARHNRMEGFTRDGGLYLVNNGATVDEGNASSN
jgi:hypothetical protein